MKLEPINSPSINQLPNAQSNTPPALTARDRAIAALMKPNTPAQEAGQQLVKNATQISPEEMTVVQAPTRKAVQNDIVEGNEASPKAETKETEESLSSHYAVLARKEKAIRQREQQLRQRESAAKALEEATKAPPKPSFDESKYVDKTRLTQDPFKVLSELGLTYDQLTELAINAPKPEQLALLNEIKTLKEEMQALKGETKKSFEDQQTAQRTEAINQIRSEVKALVKMDPQFETVRATNSVDDVVELIEKVYDKDGILLTVEDAASQVEEYLMDEAIRLAKLKKIQQRLQPKASASTEVKTTSQTEKKPLQTLTNSIASNRPVSARDRAIAAFKGELK